MTDKPNDMSQKNQNKRFLKDPIAEFTRLYSTDRNTDLQLLTELWDRYRPLKQQLKKIQNQSRKISREIGEAKRSQTPVNPLMAAMKENSTLAKNTKNQIQGIEEQLLCFFNSTVNTGTTEDPTINTPNVRFYPESHEGSNEISISLLNDEKEEWNRYVESNPAASIYHRAEWRELIKETFGHESFYFLARNSAGNIIGVLPLIRLKSRLFGDFLVSMPYFNYGGAIANSPFIEKQLINVANQQASSLGVSHIEYRDDVSRPGLPARTDKVNMLLPLPSNESQLWESFQPKLRSQIRRPQRENPDLLIGSKELLGDFYTVFSRNMRDLGTPVYGKSFFENILNYFPDKCRIIVVKLKGRPVAVAFLIGYGDTLEIPWASTIRDVSKISMNMYLYWEVLKFAVENKFDYFDFGRSSKDSGTFRFKQQWGAKPKQLYWHYWLAKDGELPALNHTNRKYAVMINTWKQMPIQFTNWLGPKIVKNLP